MAVVYRHIGLDNNEVFYIGIGKDKRRAYDGRQYKRSKFWTKYTKKHGYVVDILTDNVDFELAKEIEIALIEKYGRRDLNKGTLVNMTDGGEGILGFKFSAESLQKMSDSHKGKASNNKGVPCSDKHKESISNTNKGNTYSLGRKVTDETKAKMSKSRKGVPKSDEHKLKIKMAMLAKKQLKTK